MVDDFITRTHTELVNFDPAGKRRVVHATELADDPGLFVSGAFGANALTREEIELLAATRDLEVRLVVWGAREGGGEEDGG